MTVNKAAKRRVCYFLPVGSMVFILTIKVNNSAAKRDTLTLPKESFQEKGSLIFCLHTKV